MIKDNEMSASGTNQARVAGQAATTFFLNPASAMTGTLDFSRTETRKYYAKATEKLDSEELYDCTPGNMFHFLKLIKQRANEYGWDEENLGIMWIPEDVDNLDSELRYLPTEYGRITMDQIKKFERSYLGLHPFRDQNKSPGRWMMYIGTYLSLMHMMKMSSNVNY